MTNAPGCAADDDDADGGDQQGRTKADGEEGEEAAEGGEEGEGKRAKKRGSTSTDPASTLVSQNDLRTRVKVRRAASRSGGETWQAEVSLYKCCPALVRQTYGIPMGISAAPFIPSKLRPSRLPPRLRNAGHVLRAQGGR